MTDEDPRLRVEKRGPSVYKQWLKREGIPVIDGHHIEDMATIDLYPWARKGGKGIYINHEFSDKSNDCYVAEIPPGGSQNPDKHLFEAMIYVLKGRGATTVWTGNGPKQTFEWGEGSLFAIPLNAHYQHFNGSGTESVRYLAVTNAPRVMNFFESSDFVFQCDYPFPERYNGNADYFNGEGTLVGMVWNTNFVPDVRRFELLDYHERGAGGRNVKYKLAKNTTAAHVSEFPVGTYKKGHRHGPGAHVIILTGEGYSLMWPEDEPIQQYPWKPGSLIIPPDQWFHQHFNAGREPARYLALRLGGDGEQMVGGLPISTIDVKLGGGQIEYEDEDPLVRKLFIEACERSGAAVHMQEFWEAAARA